MNSSQSIGLKNLSLYWRPTNSQIRRQDIILPLKGKAPNIIQFSWSSEIMLQKLITNVYMQFLINILLKFKISDKWYSFQFNGSKGKRQKSTEN